MNTPWGPAIVPSTGANEMDLHELVAHIERDHTMSTRGYVVKANGWVDPSTMACHRYVVLTIEHQSESGAPVGTYYIRIDRRAERHMPALKFVRQLGRVKSSDRVRYRDTDLQIQTLNRPRLQVVLSYDQDRLLAPSKKKQVESALRLGQPLRLDRLGRMLGVIRVEFADYKLTKASDTFSLSNESCCADAEFVLQENCWAMTSVILELLETEGEGSYLHGKLCFPEWAPEVRERVRSKFVASSRASAPVPIEPMGSIAAIPRHTLRPNAIAESLETDEPIGNLMYVLPCAR